MKPHFHKVPTHAQEAYSIRHDVTRIASSIWHYHPELELHYVIRGEGVRIIGDSIANFSAGDLILLGANLPHTWRCNESYFNEDPDSNFEAIVVHFLPDWLGRDFLHLMEAHAIPKFYERARRGLSFTAETRDKVKDLMVTALATTHVDRLLALLSILNILAESKQVETIALAHAFYQSSEQETVRLNTVCSYTLANYTTEITLDEIATIANLSVTSFCRYFKMMTHKTYFDFLIEVRISHACRALVEDQLPIEVIYQDCGFNNSSNFYRHFKNVKGVSPLEYRRTCLGSVA